MSKTVVINYERSKHFRLYPISGAHGGLTPQGMISANLFMEHQLPPKQITIEASPQGTKEVGRSESSVVREVLVGLVMRPEVAEIVGKWLISQAETVKKATAQDGISQH